MEKKLRILFMGTASFAVPSLEALITSPYQLVGVVTRPPAKVGRKRILTPTAVQTVADRHHIRCLTPTRLNEDAIRQLELLSADLIITAAYGLLLPPALLSLGSMIAINLHASLLPRWRGATPIEHALIHLDKKTGITLMTMTEQLDEGPILLQEAIDIDPSWGTEELTAELAQLAKKMLLSYLATLDAKTPLFSQEQTSKEVTLAPRLTLKDRQILFDQSPALIEGHIRAFASIGGAWCDITSEKNDIIRLHILKATTEMKDTHHPIGQLDRHSKAFICKGGILKPKLVKKAGGRIMTFDEFIRGLQKSNYHATL